MIDSGEDVDNDANRSKVDCCILKTVTAINKKLDCQNAISFGSAEINRKGGFVITEPGIYCLKEDVIFNPSFISTAPVTPTPPYTNVTPAPIQAAITIRSSNVVVLLGDHTLRQFVPANPSEQVPYVIGILIPDMIPNSTSIDPLTPGGLQSIYIKGGDPAVIQDFSMYGIRVFAHTYDIRLSNITIKNCAALASKGLRPPASTTYGFEYLPHTNGNPDPITPGFGPSFGVGGLVISESTNLGMGPVFFVDIPSDVSNNTNYAGAIILENVSCLNNFFMGGMSPCVTDYTINNCHFDDTWSDDPGRETAPTYATLVAFGLNLDTGSASPVDEENGNIDPNCVNVTISNSTFNRSILRGDFTTSLVGASFPVIGMSDVNSRNVTLNNCEMNGSTNTFIGGFTCGFAAGGLEDYTFNNCHFDGIRALSTINGCHISGTTFNAPTKSNRNIRFINCTSNNHHSIGDQRLPVPVLSSDSVEGFVFAFSKGVLCEGCMAEDLIMSGPQVNRTSNAVGFQVTDNSLQPPPDPDATVQNIVFRNCVASRCYTMNGGSACGWNMQCSPASLIVAMKSIVLENCISSGNQTFTPTLTTPGVVQGSAFGFLLIQHPQTTPEEFVSFPVVFDGCKALHNKGLPSSITTSGALNPIYSSGFYIWSTLRSELFNCDAIDNVYGIFLKQSDRCVVRNCRSDNNVDLQFIPGTGEGFTDVGTAGVPAGRLGTPASPGVSTSLFENNSAYMNGNSPAAGPGVGTNLNYNVFVNAAATVALPTLRGIISASTYTINDTSLATIWTPNLNISNVQ